MTQYFPLIIPVILSAGFLIYLVFDTIKVIIHSKRLKKENDKQIKEVSHSLKSVTDIQKECLVGLKKCLTELSETMELIKKIKNKK